MHAMNKAPKMDIREREYRAEDDGRSLRLVPPHLRRAAEVRSDLSRMRDVSAYHRKTVRQIGEVGRELRTRGAKRPAKRSMSRGR